MESLRQQSTIHEVEGEFPPIPLAPIPTEDHSAPDALASLQLLWDRRALLLRSAIWALAISTAIAFVIPRKFDSTVSIMPPDSQSDTGMLLAALTAGKSGVGPSAGLASLAGSVLGLKNTAALFVDLLKSRTVQDDIVDRFNLQKVYWERYKQDAREVLEHRTTVTEDRKSGIITITVRDRERQRARDMAQAYVDELNRLLAQVSTSSARRQRIFIEQRLITVRAELENAERDFSQFASKNTALDIKEQTRAMVESAAILQGQLIATQSELQSLEQVYTSNNVRVRAAQARVEELKRQLQKLGGTDSSLATGAAQSDQLYPSIRKLPLLGVQWADLYRRTKIEETVYELLNQQYELARIQEAKEIPTVNVIDQANYPEKKSFPPRLLIIVLGILMSVIGGAAITILLDQWYRIDPHDPRKILLERAGSRLHVRLQQIGQWPPFNRSRKASSIDSIEES